MNTALGNTINSVVLERKTGKLHLITAENHTASLGFVQGEVVSAHYRISRGEKALAALQGVTEATCRFDEGADVKRDTPPLPPTEEILRALELAPNQPPTPAKEVVAEPAPQLSARSQNALRDLATEYLGPVASIVCDDVFARAETLDGAIQLLSREIANPASAETFLAEAALEL